MTREKKKGLVPMFRLCYARTVLRTNFHFSNHVLAFNHHITFGTIFYGFLYFHFQNIFFWAFESNSLIGTIYSSEFLKGTSGLLILWLLIYKAICTSFSDNQTRSSCKRTSSSQHWHEIRRRQIYFHMQELDRDNQTALIQLLKQDSVKSKPIIWARQNNYGQSIS